MIIAREDTTFDVVIGPSGNERGYMGITGNKHMTYMFIILYPHYNILAMIHSAGSLTRLTHALLT